jgi:hypothetical protein
MISIVVYVSEQLALIVASLIAKMLIVEFVKEMIALTAAHAKESTVNLVSEKPVDLVAFHLQPHFLPQHQPLNLVKK